MAKKNTTPEAGAPPVGADNSKKEAPAEKAKKVGRPAGFSSKDGDIFKAVDPQPETKIAPQAKGIANLVVAAGPAGVTRKQLVENMEGVIETRQPQTRILSYYQKALVEAGFITVTDAPAEKEEAKATATSKA